MARKKPPEKTPKLAKSSAALIEIFERAMESFPEASQRKMFGYPAAFARGNLVTGLFQESLFVRLSDEDGVKITQEGATPFAPMAGRPMRGYFVLPNSILSSESSLKTWIAKAIAYGMSLAPKAGQPKSS
jgi:TfoX/Sxy family transcriptional regulator of competence genes